MKWYIFSATILLCLAMAFSFPDKKHQNTHFESPTEALDGIAFVSAMHHYPEVDGRNGKWYAAHQFKKNMQVHARVSGADNWVSMGPDNVGGRTISMAIDPTDTSVIYLGSASGGLWKSTTGGIGANAWSYVETGFPILGVSAIAINPENHNEIFIGTGETYSYGSSTHGLITRTERGSFGMGILHTTDGGANWDISLDWTYLENRGIWDIVFHPENDGQLIAATTEGIYVTTDNGANWIQTNTNKMIMDLSVHPDAPDMIFAGAGNLNADFHGLLRSMDGGLTWNTISGGGWPDVSGIDGRICVQQWAGNPNAVYATVGNSFATVGIYASPDGGNNWTQLDDEEVLSYQGWYAKGICINPDNANNLLFGGVELWKSTNGGASLIQKTSYTGPDSELHPDIHDIQYNPLNPSQVYILTDGGLFRSGDFGESYYPCVGGYATAQFYIGSISAQSAELGLGGLQDNFTQRYVGTNDWIAVIGGDGAANAIDQEDDAQQYGSYQYGNFYKSFDGGENFVDYIFGPTGTSAFVAPLTLAASDQQVLFTGDSKLWRSDDGGGSFYKPINAQPDTGNVFLAIGVGGNNTDTLYYSTAGISGRADIFRSVDGGESFTAITQDLPDRFYRDIAVNPINAQELYIAVSGFGTGHLYKSTNMGDTWEDISAGLPDVPFHTILIDPVFHNILYAGGDMGVYVSMDKGNTWTIFGTGMPEAVLVFDLIYSPQDERIMAFTHGNGVYSIPKAEDVQISITDDVRTMDIYPTITNDIVHVMITGEPTQCTYRIFDQQGRVVQQADIRSNSSEPITIHTGRLSAGNYFIQMTYPGAQIVKSFMRI